MGKHGTEYARVERDPYRTPHWVVAALGEYVDLRGLSVWEPACGNGRMVEAPRQRCDRVYASDIVDYSAGQGEVLDFLSMQAPKLEWPPHLICTNPPFGQSGKLATAFIVTGLQRIGICGLLALLLPSDFDSAKGRARHFSECPEFVGKIVLRERVVWFKRHDGIREAPRENSAWFLWARSPLRQRMTVPRPLCADCGIDTLTIGEWYLVNNDVLEQESNRHKSWRRRKFLCIGCLEGRIGRALLPSDVTNAPINDPNMPMSDHLRDWHRLRRGCSA
jgi:hypothetical protein